VGFCRVPSAPAADVLIKGDGVAGTNAATVALGMGAQVTLSTVRWGSATPCDPVRWSRARSFRRALRSLTSSLKQVSSSARCAWGFRTKTHYQHNYNMMKHGSVLSMSMSPSIRADAQKRRGRRSIPILPLRSTAWFNIALPNIPGAVARTPIFALNNATLPFIFCNSPTRVKKAATKEPTSCN
jgi:alanine dehydrogenase